MRFKIWLAVAVTLAAPVHSETHTPWFGRPSSDGPGQTSLRVPTTIRVRIVHSKRAIRIGCTGAYDYMSLRGGKVYSARQEQIVKRAGSGIVMGGGKFLGDVLVAPVQPSDFLTVNGRRYRGALLLEPARGGYLDVVEQLATEEYLYGVLPKEVGSDWPEESLKAQAVVSRTYVMANIATDPGQRYDVSNDVFSQVYGGVEVEAPGPTKAVQDTMGEILVTSEGKPAEAFFHSSCGGYTEEPGYVWSNHSGAKGFASVRDSFCRDDPFYNWRSEFSATAVRKLLRRAGIRVSEVKKIKIAKRSPSGRAWLFDIYTSGSRVQIPGNRFRLALGPERLRSTMITDVDRTRTGFVFEGHGWGHGVGLCQYGALGRAKAGHSYRDIVAAYYPETRLVRTGSE